MGAPQYEQAGADIGGTGTTNTIPRWTGASTLGDSVITQNSTALVTTGSSSATQTTFRVRTVGTANNAPVFSLYREGVNEQVIWAGSGTIRFGFATDPAGYTDAQLLTATKMGIDASGNVGIGTASPGRKLEVLDATTGAGVVQGIRITGNASNYYDIGRDPVNGAFTIVGSQAGVPLITFLQGANERARIDSAGNLILNSANTGATIQAAGTSQGLKLQGTAGTNNTDPNVLDFYADGGTANSGGVTWTPTITFGGATTGITYQTQVGRYTRVGNMVFATCYFVLTSKGTATGNVKITGLPTSSNTTSLFTGATVGYFANIISTGQVMGYMSPNDTGIILNQTTAAGANTALTDANFANNSAIIVTIAYPVI